MTVLPLSGDAVAGPLSDGKVHAFEGGCACAGLGERASGPAYGKGRPYGWIAALLVLGVQVAGMPHHRGRLHHLPRRPSMELWPFSYGDRSMPTCARLFWALSL